MKKNIFKLLIIFISFLISSCGTVMPPGFLYSSLTSTGQILPHEKLGDKKGVSCATNYVFLFTFGDLSVKNTASFAGIKKINLVEYDSSNFFILYTYTCIIVHGE